MKKIRYFSALIFIGLINPNAHAQWVQTSGPVGGSVTSITEHANNLYISTVGGIYMSSDNGNSWFPVNNGLPPTPSIFPIVSDGSNLYAAGDDGIFISTNNGATWTSFALPSYDILSFAIIGTKMFAGTIGQGFYISHDNGITWHLVDPTFNNTFTYSIFNTGTSILISTNIGIFRSVDGGIYWNLVNNDPNLFVMKFVILGSTLYAAANTLLVITSSDDGISWTPSGAGIYGSVNTVAVKGSTLFAGTTNGLYISNNNGSAWQSSNNGFGSFLRLFNINVVGNIVFAGTWNGGIFKSIDNGLTWTQSNNGIINTEILTLLSTGTKLLAGTASHGAFKYESQSWTSISHFQNNYISSFAMNGNNIFAGTQNGIYLSQNAGHTWSYTGFQHETYSLAINGNSIYASTWWGCFISTNNGGTWAQLSNNGFSGLLYNTITVINNILYAGSLHGVYKYNSTGNNWIMVGLPNIVINALLVNGSSILAGTHFGIYKSVDGGNTWTQQNNGIEGLQIYCLAKEEGSIFAGTEDGVFTSIDNSDTWINTNAGLSNVKIKSLEISRNHIYAGTNYKGVWMRKLSELTGQEKLQPIIGPNPFNFTTTITLPRESNNVIISLIDMQGREVKLIRGEGMEFVLEKGNLAQGMYIIKISDNNFVYPNYKIAIQ